MSLDTTEMQNTATSYDPAFSETTDETNSGHDAQRTEYDEEIHEMIACRAFEIYQQRRPDEGNALTDWLQAEIEIRTSATGGRQFHEKQESKE